MPDLLAKLQGWRSFQREGRRELRREMNPIGFLLLGITVLFTFLPRGIVDFLVFLGYRGSAAYPDYGGMEPLHYYLVQGSQYVVSILVPSILYLVLRHQRVRRVVPSERIQPLVFASMLFLGLSLALFANLPSRFVVENVKSWLPWELGSAGLGEAIPAVLTPVIVMLNILRHAVFPAFFEEFLFRGIVIQPLRRFGEGFAVVTSALLFGMFHGNLEQIPFAFLVGLLLGYLLVKTNNIWLCASVHFLNNLFAVLSDLLEPYCTDMQANLVIGSVSAAVFVLAALGTVYLFIRHRWFFRVRFPRHPLTLRSRWGAFLSSAGIILVLLMNLGETFWGLL